MLKNFNACSTDLELFLIYILWIPPSVWFCWTYFQCKKMLIASVCPCSGALFEIIKISLLETAQETSDIWQEWPPNFAQSMSTIQPCIQRKNYSILLENPKVMAIFSDYPFGGRGCSWYMNYFHFEIRYNAVTLHTLRHWY